MNRRLLFDYWTDWQKAVKVLFFLQWIFCFVRCFIILTIYSWMITFNPMLWLQSNKLIWLWMSTFVIDVYIYYWSYRSFENVDVYCSFEFKATQGAFVSTVHNESNCLLNCIIKVILGYKDRGSFMGTCVGKAPQR